MNSLKMEKYCAKKCRYEWLHDISKRLRDIFFRKNVKKRQFKWFDLHSFSYFGALCAVRLLFLKYCLTVATAMMFLKKAAAAFLS